MYLFHNLGTEHKQLFRPSRVGRNLEKQVQPFTSRFPLAREGRRDKFKRNSYLCTVPYVIPATAGI